jgi:hypothetical protein
MVDAMKKRVEDFRTNAFASAMCHLLEHMTVLQAALLRRRSGTEDEKPAKQSLQTLIQRQVDSYIHVLLYTCQKYQMNVGASGKKL